MTCVHLYLLLKVNYPPDWHDDAFELSYLFVMVDKEKLERVFANLLSNALKYTSIDDHIELSFDFTTDRKYLLIKISDTGVDISAEHLPYIFDRLYMVSKAHLTNAKSSGLGLAITKEIVEYALSTNPDLIILDMMLPGLDGIEVCQELRKKLSVPIIFLSSKSSSIDKSIGLIAGGDDYIGKPFDGIELIGYSVVAHGQNIILSPKEFQLLALLA